MGIQVAVDEAVALLGAVEVALFEQFPTQLLPTQTSLGTVGDFLSQVALVVAGLLVGGQLAKDDLRIVGMLVKLPGGLESQGDEGRVTGADVDDAAFDLT